MNYPDLMKIVKKFEIKGKEFYVHPINGGIFLDSSFIMIPVGKFGSFTIYITKHKKIVDGLYDGYEIKMEKEIKSFNSDIPLIELTKRKITFKTTSPDELVKKINSKLKKVYEYEKHFMG